MKINILLRACIILTLAIVTLLLLYTSQSLLKSHQDEEFQIKKYSIEKMVYSWVEEKKQHLRNASNGLNKNGDLASTYLLAKELENPFLYKNYIKNDLQTAENFELKILSNPSESFTVEFLSRESEIFLSLRTPLYYFSDPIATLQLITPLKDNTLKSLEKENKSKIIFGLKNGQLHTKVIVDRGAMFSSLKGLKLSIFFTVLIFMIAIGVSLELTIKRLFTSPIKKFIEKLNYDAFQLKKGILPELTKTNNSFFHEIQNMSESLEEFKLSLHYYSQLRYQRTREETLGHLALQVAHDIRSPLSALSVALRNLESSKDKKDTIDLLNHSIQRINEVADSLIGNGTPNDDSLFDERPIIKNKQKESKWMVLPLIDSILNEKRLQHYNHPNIRFQWEVESQGFGLFCNRDAGQIKRVVSNLMNNAITALEGNGVVSLSIVNVNNTVEIKIKDDGTGLHSSQVQRINHGLMFSTKMGGQGLGLTHAHEIINKLGGHLSCESELGMGTEICISLPSCEPPIWYTPRLHFEDKKIVIVDDDPNWHKIWIKKISESQLINNELVQFNNLNQLEFFAKSNSTEDCIFLVDYHFYKDNRNGLDIIEKLNLENRSFLVTNDFYNVQIKNRVSKIGLNMIPKMYLQNISISESA